jgi:hypothetical protein
MRPSAVAWAALMLLPAGMSAQDTQWNRYTLEGLEGVFVRAEATEACEAAGVSTGVIQTDATATLEGADVLLLTEAAMLEAPGHPELRISVDCSEEDDNAIAYAISLRVQQAAQLVRDPQVTLPEAVTWYASTIGIADADDASSVLEDALDAQLEEFAAAWTAANVESGTPGGD